MYNYIRLVFFSILLGISACTKEEFVSVLQDKYEPNVQEAEPSADEFTVNLNARALQNGERGEWKILQGTVVDNYVYIENRNNPFTRFKGLPGQEYTLEWTRWDAAGKASVVKTTVKIAPLNIEIKDTTPAIYQTILRLSVDSKYKGRWSVDQAYGYITTKFFDGYAEAPENKPSIELHGYANTPYTATYTYTYAGREYKFQRLIKTGDYTQDDALYELQMSRGDTRIVEDKLGNILELNLQGSGIAWRLKDQQRYPALRAFKKLRKLILGGSSLDQIPDLFGDHYTDLEDLSMDRIGSDLVFPDNFGNLNKLRTLLLTPLYSTDVSREVILPASFGKLKALESFSVTGIGSINFNGTLGQLTNLRYLNTYITEIPENIGDLKNLQHINLVSRNAVIPQRFAESRSLTYVRINFIPSATRVITLPARIGDLKQLQTLDITASTLYELPASFSELTALRILKLGTNLRSIPEDFGNLSSLEDLTLHGTFTKLPNSFGKLSRLAYLYLGGKTESLPESFGDLSSLVYLNAESSNLKTLPATFGKLKKLGEISLSNSKLEYLPESFGELDGLVKLNLAYTQLKAFPKSIIPLKSISSVILNGNYVGDIPADISRMKKGVVFNLYGVPNLSPEHMTYIKSISNGAVFYTNFGYF
ncbi:hypothetical protein GZH53_13445 [Flavihumibacter sp. R14]|nr:hypothetical protein [Flavihumibacter soli]